jgi:nucleoside-diphosphate-sugar epimerase
MKIFVSGATGFLGRAVIGELAKRGHEVVGLVETEGNGPVIEKLGGRYVVGNLLKEGPWMDEVYNSYRVVSLTWPIPFSAKPALDDMTELAMRHGNEVGNLLRAGKGGEVKSAFITYDTTCFGDNRDIWVTEPTTMTPTGYCRPIGPAKDEIERVAAKSGIPLVDIYPGRVYGPSAWFGEVITRLREGTWNLAGDGHNHMSLIHIDDLAWGYSEAIERFVHKEGIPLVDGYPVTQVVLMGTLADALGVKHPDPMDFHEFAKTEGIMLAESLAEDAMIDSAKATKLLDFKPKYTDYRSGIVATLKAMGIEPKIDAKKAA